MSAQVLAEARAIDRNPTGSNASMLARNASTDSAGVPSENIVGSRTRTNSAGGRSANTSAWSRRCSATPAGREPAHPAYADARS
jgi:hypothetical protein